MKPIALITFAGLVLFATAVAAHQNGWGNNHKRENGNIQHAGYSGGGCAVNTNMMGRGIMNGKRTITAPEISGSATRGTQTNSWETDPSYQGQVGNTTTTGK